MKAIREELAKNSPYLALGLINTVLLVNLFVGNELINKIVIIGMAVVLSVMIAQLHEEVVTAREEKARKKMLDDMAEEVAKEVGPIRKLRMLPAPTLKGVDKGESNV